MKYSWDAWVDLTSISADAIAELDVLLKIPIENRMSSTSSISAAAKEGIDRINRGDTYVDITIRLVEIIIILFVV
jgi:hypothetical protein